MFIKYFIPEDGDEQTHPNIFKLESSQPTFSEIKKSFPVPGIYHFRFLKNVGSHIVWLDVSDDSSPLPMYQGSIFIKVSRIAVPSSTKSQPSSNGFVASASNSTANNTSNNTAVPTAPTTTNSPPTKAPKPSPSLDRRNSEKLLKFDDDVAAPTKSSSAAPDIFAASAAPIPASTQHSTDNDLLGLGLRSNSSDAGSIKQQTSSAASADFFGLEALKPTPQSAMGAGNSGHSNRSMSPMGGGGAMNPLNPMGGGSIGSGMNTMGGSSTMGHGGMNPMGGGRSSMTGGGMGGGMSSGGMGAPRSQGGGPGTPGYDPFNSLMQGNSSNNNGNRGTGRR